MMRVCEADKSFGPLLPLNQGPPCRTFDFTLLFERVCLVLIPNLAILPVIVMRCWNLRRREPVVAWHFMSFIKAAILFIYSGSCLGGIVVCAQRLQSTTAFALPAQCAAFLSTVSLAMLAMLEHLRSPRPSQTVQMFLLFTLFLDAACLRTQWLIANDTKDNLPAIMGTLTISSKLLVLIIESMGKAPHYIFIEPPFQPEERSGFFGRTFLTWLIPLLRQGYKNELSIEDLYAVDIELSGSELTKKLHASWLCIRQDRRRRLALAIARAFWGPLVRIQLPRFFLVGCAIAQPFLVQATLTQITLWSSRPTYFGHGLVLATALTYVGIAISTVWYQQLTFRFLTMVRGSLVGLIFRSTLSSNAQEAGNSARPVNLMSTEIDRIAQTLQWALNIIPNIVQVALGLWILTSHLHAISVAPIIVALVCGILAGNIGKRIPPRQARWMRAIQKRVAVTTDSLGLIKGVKISGLTPFVSGQIEALRVSEIEAQKSFRRLQLSNIVLGNVPAMVTPALTFSAFALSQSFGVGNGIETVTVFTSLSLLAILIMPIAELITATTNLASTLSCLDRIQDYVRQNSAKDEKSFGRRPEVCSDSSDGGRRRSMDIAMQNIGNHGITCSGPPKPPSVRLMDASIGWKDVTPILYSVNLAVVPSSVMMVTGPVGSGKSTLLKSLFGESFVISGVIDYTSPRQVAYCAQEPWIPNMTIRDIVLGRSPYEASRYSRVIEACQLIEDISQLEKGHSTLVGSKGISLSGGQKQRIALARALYSRKELIVLDDTFSGLDNTTSLKILKSLLRDQGIVRSENRTIVLVTHNAQLLAYADEIVTVDNGRVEVHPNLDILTSNAREDDRMDKPEIVGTLIPPTTIETITSPSPDTMVSKNKPIRPLCFYIQSIGKGAVLVFVSLVVLHIGCNTAQILWLKIWVSSNSKDASRSLGYWVGIYLTISTLTVLCLGLETGYFLLSIVPRSAKSIHRILLIATIRAPLAFFATNDVGRIVNLFTGDMNLVDLQLPLSFLLTVERTASTIAELALTCIASGYMAALIPVILAVVFILQRIYVRTSRQIRVLDLESKAPLFTHFIETFTGRTTIRAFSWTSATEEHNVNLLNVSQRPYYLLYCLQRWLTLVLDLITAGLATILVALTVSLPHRMDPGLLGVALVTIMNFGSVLSQLVSHWSNLETSLGSISRIQKHVDTTPMEGNRNVGATIALPANWPTKGDIILRDVTASYGASKVLENINVKFEAGAKVAVCGRTGSGKSSLLAALARLIELDNGCISIDGLDISQLPLDQFRSAVVALPQDPVFLNGTIRLNLDPYEKQRNNDNAVRAALQRVGLWNLVEKKGGLDVELNTSWLSAGEAQLFCFARAMLQKSKVLLLDEVTSHLDPQSEKTVNDLIKSEFDGWTVISVLHQLSNVVSDFDRVLVLHEGQVVEYDTPGTLLRRNSRFKAMMESSSE